MKRFFIKNASLLLPCGLQTGSIEFDSTITALRRSNDSCAPDYECETLDAHGGFVVPGLFDIHTHGACGADFSDADFSDEKQQRRIFGFFQRRGFSYDDIKSAVRIYAKNDKFQE